ncbi:MAG: M48 family metallopeptidase [Anaerolineales bacterium]
MSDSKIQTPSEVAPDEERQQEAREYARINRRLMGVELVLALDLVVAFLVTGASKGFKQLLLAAGLTSPWLLVPVYVGFLYLAYTVFLLPLSWWQGYVLRHRYDLSTQSLESWWEDQLKMHGLSLALMLPVVEVVYWMLRSQPNSWWIWTAGLMVVLSVILGYLLPVLFVPLFYDLTPLEDEELVRRIERLAEETDTVVAGVYTIDLSTRTTAANALVMGMGRTKRIALGDTLYEDFTPDEIETILAHELAHQVHHDTEIGVVVQSVLMVASLYVAHRFLRWGVGYFGFDGPGDVAALPLLMLATALFSLLTMPLLNAYSRWRERAADHYALRVTGKAEAFARAMLRLANQNLAELEPPDWVVWLLYSHPPIMERVELARTYPHQGIRDSG